MGGPLRLNSLSLFGRVRFVQLTERLAALSVLGQQYQAGLKQWHGNHPSVLLVWKENFLVVAADIHLAVVGHCDDTPSVATAADGSKHSADSQPAAD